jgi:lysophospholipase L1-like esterase
MLSSRRRPSLGVLIALLIVSCAPARPGPDAALAAKLGPEAPLMPFYRALVSSPTVVILQIGDSRTTNDTYSGRMRELFQARFGDAGWGVLPPGVPYRGYKPAHVSVTQEDWSVVSSDVPGAPGPFGIAGVRQHASGPATMTLTVDDSDDLAHAEIEVLRQPGGGTLLAQLEHGSRAPIATTAPTRNAAWQPVPPAAGSRTLTVEALGDGPVDLLGWNIARGRPGVIYANLGTPGTDVDAMDRWDPTLVRQELQHLTPSLIMLAVGTEAGLRDSVDVAAYAEDLGARLRELHAAAPQAALLVLAPPDEFRPRRRNSPEPAACGDPQWTAPPNLGAIRLAQRVVAPREGAYFWDWQAVMGGPCAMLRRAPHLSAAAYRTMAEALFRTLMDGYQRYRQALRPAE